MRRQETRVEGSGVPVASLRIVPADRLAWIQNSRTVEPCSKCSSPSELHMSRPQGRWARAWHSRREKGLVRRCNRAHHPAIMAPGQPTRPGETLSMRTPCHSRAPHHGAIPCLVTIVTASALCASWTASAEAPGKVDFARQIRPILAENCFECHGPDERGRKGNLRLDSREDVFADRDGHRVVAAGVPEESELIARITSDDPDAVMPPPKSRRQLTKPQIELLTRWVGEGAPWSEHWSFVPPRRPEIPPVATPGWCRNSIDRFVLAKLDRAGLRPSPEADRATLIRRLCLDILGLPPTISEVEQFVSDGRPDAYARLVDRLLASPQFGERWARPWLDLVRYADSDGYEDDRYRPDSWRYRDWVIDAFNQDIPFDRFTIEQLAGDLVPGGSLGPRVATGFHRMTMFNRTAVGRDNEEEFRVKTAKDRASTTATVWLGLTFGCAECHATSTTRSPNATITGSTPSSTTWSTPKPPLRL